MELFRPVNPDKRGYTNCFECNSCGANIYTASYCQEIEYNYCPYCADAGIMRLKEKVASIIKANNTGVTNIKVLAIDGVADLLRIDRDTGDDKED